MFFARSARFALQPLRQPLAASRRWLLLVAILLAVVCFGLLKPSTAVVQNQPPLGIVSAASNEADALAPESLATAYGLRLATQSDSAATPQPQLAGTTVEVAGRAASLLLASPEQINFLVPAGTPPGPTTITVRAADGTVSTGTTNINAVAPALFNLNGVAIGYVVRVKPDNSQVYDAIGQVDPSTNQYRANPIDLSKPGERIFLVLFLSGIRHAADLNGDGDLSESVSVIIGGASFTPAYAGAVPGVPGLDQINLELPPSLQARGAVGLTVTARDAAQFFRASKPAQIEISGVTELTNLALSKTEVLAGETLEITGNFQGLSATGAEVLFEGAVGVTPPFDATRSRLTVRVPFGVARGKVRISDTQRIVWTSPEDLRVRTSVSGFIQDTNKRGVPGLLVSLRGRGISAPTNQDGAFVLPDAPPSGRQYVDIQSASTTLNYPAPSTSLPVIGQRDNFIQRLEVQGVSLPGPPLAAAAENPAADPIVVVPSCSGNCPFTVTPFAAGRTPVDLPPGYFSSNIAQITPFGSTITPARRLRLLNVDGVTASQAANLRVFKLDQKPDSNTFGQFIDIGPATLAADGYLETAADAVTEGSYYFAAPRWPTATIIGHVVEADGQRPVRRAIVYARGQSTLTDGNGGFVLRDVPVLMANDAVTVEVSFHRADGSVARAELAGVAINAGAQVLLGKDKDIKLSAAGTNAGPKILAPETLTITEGETRNFTFVVLGLPANVLPELTGPSFATRRNDISNYFLLTLAPPAGSAGTYPITLTATDAQNNTARQVITVQVLAASNVPTARWLSIATDEDTPIGGTLLGSSNTTGTPTYSIVTPPLHGTLSPAGPNLTSPNLNYIPVANYNGTDSFTFKVGSGNDPRSIGTVFIIIRPVNDPPVITSTFGPQTVDAGQTLKLTITATDPDGDLLTLTVPNAPDGATQNPPQIAPNTWQFTWTPVFTQTGSYSLNFTVTDNATPASSASRMVPVTVNAKWAKTSLPDGASVKALAASGTKTFAGTQGGGVYVSGNGGQLWTQSNQGLGELYVEVLVVKGTSVFAGTRSGVYVSNDEGRTWTPAGLSGIWVAAMEVSGDRIWAGTYSGVFVTSSDGQNWTNVGLDEQVILAITVKQAKVYAGAAFRTPAPSGGVYVTSDDGQSWVRVGLADIQVETLLVNGAQIFAGTSDGVYVSSNNDDQSWLLSNNGLVA